MGKKTRKDYEIYLNGIGASEDDMIIGGKLRRGRYGTMLRKYDPIGFAVGFREYQYC